MSTKNLWKENLIDYSTTAASYFLITLCSIRNLSFQKRLQFFDYSVIHKKSLISKKFNSLITLCAIKNL